MSQTSFKPRTFNGDLSHLPHALLPLTRMEHWVLWCWQARTSKGQVKWTKPPYQIGNPKRLAKSNQPSTWGSYEDAVPIVAAGNSDGIGFQLNGSHIAAVDLDHVRDMATGEITPRAKELITEAANVGGVYIEVTVSGTGIRFIGLSNNAEEIHRKYTLDPTTGEAIELYRNCARYITVSGLITDLPPCPVLDVVDGFFERLQARFDVPVQSRAVMTSFDFDLNDAGPQQIDYEDLIQNGVNEGERSEEFARVVWHPSGQGKSAEEIVEEIARHPAGIGRKYAGRLQAEVDRSYAKWQTHRRNAALGSPTVVASVPWPQIRIIPGELPRVVNEAEDALLLLGREVYQRGGVLVRPQLVPIKASADREFRGWRLVPITWPYLIELFSCAARFLKYDRRKQNFVQTDVSRLVAEAYLARGKWKMPHIVGIANAPFLHADGSIHDREGYDPVSGLLCKWDGQAFPPVPPQPTKDDAIASLAELEKPLSEFPFETPADKAAALSAILTALDRRGMDVVPLHAFTAPAAGTGKGLLVDIVAMLATGRPMPTIDQSRHDDELKKCLGASLIAGDSLIALDNCQHVLEGSLLNIITKQHVFRIRVFGQSQNMEISNSTTLFANGNNLIIGADMTRRVILCEMNANMERPELREFKDEHLLETVQVNRAKLVVAALTVLRAWHLARPSEGLKLTPLDFNDWSRRVREALVWLGHADPGNTMEKTRKDDPYRLGRAAVFTEWHRVLGEGAKLVRDVVSAAFGDPPFYASLLTVAASSNGREISPERLGRWLARNKGAIVNDLTLIRTGGVSGGYPRWQIQKH
jgi:hypothetical protein